MNEKIKKLFGSPSSENLLLKLVVVIGLLIIVIIIFLAGEEVGYHKAQFSSDFNDSYNKMFGARPMMQDNTLLSSHGADGIIVKISLPQIIIEDANGTEKIITINSSSLIKESRDTVASTTLQVGDEIIVLGEPGQNGDVVAGLIRVIPAQPNQSNN